MTDSISTVSVRRVAESLARISDNDDGFKPEVADIIEADLRARIPSDWDPDALHPAIARMTQEAWLRDLREAIS